MTARHVANLVRATRDLALGRVVWESRPFHVEISSNNACNLKCVMCERPGLQFLPPEELRRVAGEVMPGAVIVTPSATSEPAMGDFDLMLDLCEEHGTRLNLITNGTLLTERHFHRLRGRVFKVEFSCDSHVPSVYERIRVNGRFEHMLRGLRGIVALAAEDGFPVELVLVLMTENLESLPGFMAFARAMGVRSVRVQKLLPFFRDPGRFDVEEHFTPEEIRAALDRAVAAAKREGLALRVDLRGGLVEHDFSGAPREPDDTTVIHHLTMALAAERRGFCHQLATYVRIVPDGSVYPCCRGGGDFLRMGNVRESSFAAIWNGEPYRRLREEFHAGRLRPGCDTCTLSGRGNL